ncbi:hypothetical protein BU24DRAFT_421160 [Aaosphaeria arxii CBS 175.79]|uniref:RlpA-like protein double-psi beta-barrel domain-containing protein n=1 Tax=Aaosphaeria arxii CBS 175.79 TaxID=1450172 RepID=A0A6A5XZZ5_9PLEO|nr:uncharacterized protein BU24DRAFT_421160 [Aaosphaeria arxii CBS 175.79]KAF2018160.1 hypothetical protein BU24DRAFT_421160 [Aaosphaeria arxii CBS 175.79]
MKTCTALSALLFGSIAAAIPLRQRDLVTKTEVVVETIVVYTTVYDEAPVPEATSTPGLFFEKPHSTEAVPSSTSVYVAPSSSAAPPPPAPKVEEPSSVYTPPPAPTTTEAPPAPKVEAPTSVYTPPPAAPSSAAPVSSAAPEKPVAPIKAPTGNSHSGDITIYDNTGAAGACGKPLTDGDMIVALAKGAWGESTYDVMTGESTNPWCGKTITVEYNGNSIQAQIMDMCPGCSGEYDIDLSVAAWKALTGSDEKTRYQATWYES